MPAQLLTDLVGNAIAVVAARRARKAAGAAPGGLSVTVGDTRPGIRRSD